MIRANGWVTAAAAWAGVLAAWAVPNAGAAEAVDFNRDIRPILTANCFACHGPDKDAKAGLRLSDRDLATHPNPKHQIAIVPGHPETSQIVRRIFSDDPDVHMPPPDSHKRLTEAQKQTLKQWIAEGAVYEKHWAYVPAKRWDPPAVKDVGWCRNTIDRFVLAKLESKGLHPSPEADRPTLIRRASFDVTGLPPSPADVRAFVEDKSPNAYEKMLDRLFASPRYGERMAMWWLDGARYADSHGFQSDWERYQWRWRDGVIDAFNRDEPYDQFTIDQIAGDLRPNATLDQQIASGFNRNARVNTEGGAIAQEWLTETVIDRVSTTSEVWLGVTMGCARCHDHKYDPFTQKDFYSLFAYFYNVPENGTGDAERAGNFKPYIKAPRPFETARLAELDKALADAKARDQKLAAGLPALQREWEKKIDPATLHSDWTPADPVKLAATGKVVLKTQPDHSVLATGPNPAKTMYTLTLKPGLKILTGFQLEALPDDALSGHGPGRSENGNFVLYEIHIAVDGKPVRIERAEADFSQKKFPVASLADPKPRYSTNPKPKKHGPGWGIDPQFGKAHRAAFTFDPVLLSGSSTVTVTLGFDSRFPRHTLGRFRIAFTDVAKPRLGDGDTAAVAAILKTPEAKRTAKQKAELAAYFRAHLAGPIAEADLALRAAQKQRDDYYNAIPTVMVMSDAKPRQAHILIRGQYDHPGEAVSPAVPASLNPLPKGAPANRLGLAEWIVDPANPLTARVAVNRFWELYFGAGICRSSDNLGVQAEYPTHPKLLDWLATEFVRLHWDMKAIQKKILMSATYRQSSATTPGLAAADPENRLLARGPRFRLQAEEIRDNALAIAGLLVNKIGGPSVYPYQPAGVWDETSVYGNMHHYKHATDDGLYRRSLYTIWKRTAAAPDMLLFDMPSREICQVKRARTDTPLQALALMNEVTFVEASRVLAQHMIEQGGATPASRIDFAYRRALGRDATDAEKAVLIPGLLARLDRYRHDPDAAKKLITEGQTPPDPRADPAELAAYTMTASVILNLDQTITKE